MVKESKASTKGEAGGVKKGKLKLDLGKVKKAEEDASGIDWSSCLYEGEWRDSHRQGKARLIFPDGRFARGQKIWLETSCSPSYC